MDNGRELHEDAYEADDGDEAYQGMDAYTGDDGIDSESEGVLYGIRIVSEGMDDEDEDYMDDGDEDEEADDFSEDADELEDENEVDAIAEGRRAQDALEAIQELETLQNNSPDEVGSVLQNLLSGRREISTSIGSDTATASAVNRVLTYLRTGSGNRQVFLPIISNQVEDDNDDDAAEIGRRLDSAPRRKWAFSWWKKAHTEPQPVGVELLNSGEFGRIGHEHPTSLGGSRNFARILRERSMRVGIMPKQDLCEYMVPNSAGSEVATYPASVYCGQFSADSSFYYVCCKDFNLHIYDMTAPRRRDFNPNQPFYYDHTTNHKTTMKVHKSIKGVPEGWTITDSHLSPDNERLIYSSMSPTVHMTKTLEYDSSQTPISFSDTGRRYLGWGWGDDTVIWSCRFSADGNEVIAGGRGKIFVYDLLANRRTVKIPAHDDDVNSCCWADSGSNVLISASDDTFIKIWDRRSLGSSARPSGVLIGHTEGITNVSAKGDGRYVISNGKDQALRLWDLRKMASDSEYRAVKDRHYGLDNFDYRYADNRPQKQPAHPKDCSIMTYRGHSVMRTLIRCHFSPAESTGSRYIYSGSLDGKVHIWSLDGRIVQILDRAGTLPMSFEPSGPELPITTREDGASCVRDVSWHSREPVMLSAAWGANGTSSVARHEWKGLTKMNGRLEDWEEKRAAEAGERIHVRQRVSERTPLRRSVRLSAMLPGSYNSDDDDYITEEE